MRRTRSSKSAKPGTEKSPPISEPDNPLPESNDKNPPKCFILPKGASPEARIVTLPNPRTLTPTRYYLCPERGIYEFTKITAPKSSPRSWLLAPQTQPAKAVSSGVIPSGEEGSSAEHEPAKAPSSEPGSILTKGYAIRSADLFIATPLDPLFLIIPALAPVPNSGKHPKQLFLSSDDYFDTLSSTSRHYGTILQIPRLRMAFEARMDIICDTVDAGGERMYRLNEEKLMRELLRKANEVVDKGLPASLEESFVKKALEVPVACVKREESLAAVGNLDPEDETQLDVAGAETPSTESTVDSQTSTTSTITTLTSVSQLPEPAPFSGPPSAPALIARLLRLRTALTYLSTTYIPAHLVRSPSPSIIDFTPLTSHLTHLASLREEAFASRSLGDYSCKRALDDDGEEESRAEKKRKKEEEERRKKAGESRGVRDLKKVDVRGMKKMSDFFGKKKT
ncbi:hypothetical protein FGG08_002943 [Glutinoglossum americanum]|uniref:Ribonuclease H2 subunit B n=1 Tax=Glutinoglossum americanum TaxID=1670608 RepID=A0A9P8L440_9PEZI|nr:hypothetical protein FGG08_002943 [Glutinoglossum americanum]